MSKHNIVWDGKKHFTCSTPDGRQLMFDVPVENGGDGTAPTPMEAQLHALAACSAVDVVSIMEKMRMPVDSLHVEVEAVRADDHPRVYTGIHMVFVVTGDLPLDKLERAVALSADKYCSIGAMLRGTAQITHEIKLNGGNG
jgi:putative redox protein